MGCKTCGGGNNAPAGVINTNGVQKDIKQTLDFNVKNPLLRFLLFIIVSIFSVIISFFYVPYMIWGIYFPKKSEEKQTGKKKFLKNVINVRNNAKISN